MTEIQTRAMHQIHEIAVSIDEETKEDTQENKAVCPSPS